MDVPNNLFGYKRPVTTYQDFVGRRKEVHRLLTSLGHSQSISVVGIPGIGETSLLLCVLLPEMLAEFRFSFQHVLPLYVNMHSLPAIDASGFFEFVLTQLEGLAQHQRSWGNSFERPTKSPTNSWSLNQFQDYTRRFWTLRQAGFTPLLMIDEMDYVVVNPNVDLSLFKYMAALEADELAVFVWSSHQRIDVVENRVRQRLGLPKDLSSKQLPNLLYLLPFTQQEAEHLLSRLFPELCAHPNIQQYVLALSGGHPYLLQLAAYHAAELLRLCGALDFRSLWNAFLLDAEPLFDQLWEIFGEGLREVSEASLESYSLRAGSAHQHHWHSDPSVRELLTRGILLSDDSHSFRVFSYAFGYYVLHRRRHEARKKRRKGELSQYSLQQALSHLKNRLQSHSPPDRYQHFTILEARLLENLQAERLYGSNEVIRSERARILGELNRISLQEIGTSFVDLAR